MSVPTVRIAPDVPPAPGLVIVPSIFGIPPDLEQQMADFADDALVVAIDPFWRRNPGPMGYDSIPQALARARGTDMGKVRADLRRTVAELRDDPACNGCVMALGICYGGRFAFLAAAEGLVDAAATWHAGRLVPLLDKAADIEVPLSMHFGDQDRSTPVEDVDAIRAAFVGRDDVEIALYPGAGHGFSHYDADGVYHEAACRGGMEGVRKLLRALQ